MAARASPGSRPPHTPPFAFAPNPGNRRPATDIVTASNTLQNILFSCVGL
jgi:hypothetical protein